MMRHLMPDFAKIRLPPQPPCVCGQPLAVAHPHRSAGGRLVLSRTRRPPQRALSHERVLSQGAPQVDAAILRFAALFEKVVDRNPRRLSWGIQVARPNYQGELNNSARVKLCRDFGWRWRS